jgi:hypothetical protein
MRKNTYPVYLNTLLSPTGCAALTEEEEEEDEEEEEEECESFATLICRIRHCCTLFSLSQSGAADPIAIMSDITPQLQCQDVLATVSAGQDRFLEH